MSTLNHFELSIAFEHHIYHRKRKLIQTVFIMSQPIFQCYLYNGTLFDQSVIVAILHYSANLVLTLSYLAKTPHLNGVYYAKWQAEIGVQIMDNLTCNFNRTRVLF